MHDAQLQCRSTAFIFETYYFLKFVLYIFGDCVLYFMQKMLVFQDLLPSPQDHDHRLQLVSKLKIDTKIASSRCFFDHLLHCRVGLGAFSVSYYRSRQSCQRTNCTRVSRYQSTLPISGTVSTKIYQRTDTDPYSYNLCDTRSCV